MTARPQIHGSDDNPVQIDEARFAGHRKYNRGRILRDDRFATLEVNDAEVANNNNHDAKFGSPWAFCLQIGLVFRYFYVESRDRMP